MSHEDRFEATVRRVFGVLLISSALYAVAGVTEFTLVVGPFPGAERANLLAAAIRSLIVLMPYGFLFHALAIAQDRAWLVTVASAATIASAIGAFAYYGSFAPNDGEYALIDFVAPVVQLTFVLPVWAVVWLRGRKAAPTRRLMRRYRWGAIPNARSNRNLGEGWRKCVTNSTRAESNSRSWRAIERVANDRAHRIRSATLSGFENRTPPCAGNSTPSDVHVLSGTTIAAPPRVSIRTDR